MPGWLARRQLRGLYAIIDPAQCGPRGALSVAEAVLRGGCAVLQLRDKTLDDAALRPLASALAERCQQAGVPLVINDRPALALDLLAQRPELALGLHLGQHDMPLERARQHVGALPVGLSTHSLAQARAAQARGADLIGFGPVFTTASKTDPDPVVGLLALAEVCRAVSIPVVAIGGVGVDNIAAVASTGVPMAAAISALCRAADPEAAARRLHGAMGS